MDWLGELLRDLIAPIYPLRVPIAVGSLVGLVVLALVARRRGWFAAARRHPGRTTILAAAVLAVALPLGWWLGSPLFITTALDEPAPTAPAAPTATATAPPTPATAPTDAPPGGPVGRTGRFVGADEFHFGSGTASLIEVAPGSWTLRFEDFSVRNGPDLYVYLSPDAAGYVEGAVELGTLKATEGSFNTEVPAGTDVAAMRSVVIWCKAFSVQFAVAELR